MNNVGGVKFYSCCETLREMAQEKRSLLRLFYKTPEAQKRAPDSLSTILMQ